MSRRQPPPRKAPKRKAGKGAPSVMSDLAATGRTASRALTIFKGAVSLLNAELKHADVVTSVSQGTTPTLTYLSGIAQGDTSITRDGASVKLKSFHFKMSARANVSSAQPRVRCILFVDTRSQGVVPAAADLVGISTAALEFPNLDTEPGRFTILRDWFFTHSVAVGPVIKNVDEAIPELAEMHLLFSGTGATIASAKGPVVYLYTYCSDNVNQETIDLTARAMYVDN